MMPIRASIVGLRASPQGSTPPSPPAIPGFVLCLRDFNDVIAGVLFQPPLCLATFIGPKRRPQHVGTGAEVQREVPEGGEAGTILMSVRGPPMPTKFGFRKSAQFVSTVRWLFHRAWPDELSGIHERQSRHDVRGHPWRSGGR